MTRVKKKRLLEKFGFTHVSGWVRETDAPEIRAVIDANKPLTEAVQRWECE